MAVNTINGKNIIDPSKRIRAAVGEEYADNLENEAIQRLAAAISSNGIRRRDDYIEEKEEDNDMRLRDILKNHTTHTNPVKSNETTSYGTPEEQSQARADAYYKSQEKLNYMIDARNPFVEKVVRNVTGFGIHDSKDANLAQFTSSCIKNVVSFGVNDSIETSFGIENNKAIGISTGVATGLNFVTQFMCSGNSKRVQELFDSNVITATEAAAINKTIRNEKIKYAAEHTVASVVAPAAIKYGIDKIVKNKNTAVKYLTSFGVLSEAGKIALAVCRRANEKKAIALASAKSIASSDGSVAISGYNDVAKIAINHVMNECFDETLVGSALGTFVGVNCVKTHNEPSVTSKALAAFNAKTENSVTKVVAKEEKPAVTTTKETKPATSTAAKKSA